MRGSDKVKFNSVPGVYMSLCVVFGLVFSLLFLYHAGPWVFYSWLFVGSGVIVLTIIDQLAMKNITRNAKFDNIFAYYTCIGLALFSPVIVFFFVLLGMAH